MVERARRTCGNTKRAARDATTSGRASGSDSGNSSASRCAKAGESRRQAGTKTGSARANSKRINSFFVLGSARALRAGCGALAATNFCIMTSERNRDREGVIADTRGRVRSPEKQWLNRFAWFTAFATLLLICSGGMVTSKGVGLAVPDWPTTFGYNMFLFPASKWIGGIFFEHTHPLIASTVGFLTIILAGWLWRSEDREWVRNLGVIAVAAVVLQGVLGGLRVTMLKNEIGIV